MSSSLFLHNRSLGFLDLVLFLHIRGYPKLLNSDPWTSSEDITWELVTNADFQAYPRPAVSRSTFVFNKISRWFLGTFKFEVQIITIFKCLSCAGLSFKRPNTHVCNVNILHCLPIVAHIISILMFITLCYCCPLHIFLPHLTNYVVSGKSLTILCLHFFFLS